MSPKGPASSGWSMFSTARAGWRDAYTVASTAPIEWPTSTGASRPAAAIASCRTSATSASVVGVAWWRVAVPGQVERHRPAARQRVHHRGPHAAIEGQPVQEDDRGPAVVGPGEVRGKLAESHPGLLPRGAASLVSPS